MATSMLRMMPLLLAGSFLLLGPESTFAQRKKGLTRFAADMVTLKSGERLRGALLGEQPDGTVSMAVQRKWLEKNEAEMYRTVTETEAQAAARQSTQLRDRLRRWIDEQADANTLVAFLETELDRVDEQVDRLNDRPGGGLGTQFVMLSLPKNRLDFWFAQPPENRRVAGLAWSERLADVETREVGDLIEELKSKRIDPERDTFRLTDRVPGRAQSDREWAARQAIVEFEYGKRVEFQGMGSTLLRTGTGAKKIGMEQMLAEMLPQLLQSQLTNQLGGLSDLLNEPGLGGNRPKAPAPRKPDLSKAIEAARQEKVRGFRVTQLELNINQKVARVVGSFVARMPDGEWVTVWSETVNGDATQARPELRERIEKDPQVAGVLKTVKGLGLGIEQQLGTALQFGAATMEAQQQADRQFIEFRERHLDRLDNPPLSVR
jgi:hypothetical protein